MHSSDPTFHVLHLLRLRGVCPKQTLIAVTGLQADELEPILWPLEDDGLVEHRIDDHAAGWSLTGKGRDRHRELLAADRDAGDLAAALHPSYIRFQEADRPFLDLCADPRIGPGGGAPGDHLDPALLRRLWSVHEIGGPAAEQAGSVVERFASYAPRLAYAFGRVRDGEPDWLTDPTIESYRTVWSELHEDLLQSQGIERG